jgi:hypothetical protein
MFSYSGWMMIVALEVSWSFPCAILNADRGAWEGEREKGGKGTQIPFRAQEMHRNEKGTNHFWLTP